MLLELFGRFDTFAETYVEDHCEDCRDQEEDPPDSARYLKDIDYLLRSFLLISVGYEAAKLDYQSGHLSVFRPTGLVSRASRSMPKRAKSVMAPATAATVTRMFNSFLL